MPALDPVLIQRQWPHLAAALAPVAQQMGVLRTDADAAQMELEARLGRTVMRPDGRTAFVPGVSGAFMAKVLWRLETSAAWQCVMDWTQQVDRFYTLANGKPVRTSTCVADAGAACSSSSSSGSCVGSMDYDDDDVASGAPCLSVTHMTKSTVSVQTLKWEGSSSISAEDADCLYDVRVSLQRETPVLPKDLPVRVDAPHCIRVKQRKSFGYTPAGATACVWRMDVSLVFQATTLDDAYELLRLNQVSSYEIELECVRASAYFTAIKHDCTRLASSILAKLCDFFPPSALAHSKLVLS